MTELNKLTEYVDKHVFLAAHIHGYLWGISKNAIIGISVNEHFPFVVNNIYLKNALKDDDDNFCSLDVYEYNNENLTPKIVQLDKYENTDKLESFIRANNRAINVKHFELTKTDPKADRRLTIRDFVSLIMKTDDELTREQTE